MKNLIRLNLSYLFHSCLFSILANMVCVFQNNVRLMISKLLFQPSMLVNITLASVLSKKANNFFITTRKILLSLNIISVSNCSYFLQNYQDFLGPKNWFYEFPKSPQPTKISLRYQFNTFWKLTQHPQSTWKIFVRIKFREVRLKTFENRKNL